MNTKLKTTLGLMLCMAALSAPAQSTGLALDQYTGDDFDEVRIESEPSSVLVFDEAGNPNKALLTNGLTIVAGQLILAPSWLQVTGKPSTFPPSLHTHAIADVIGLQEALDEAGGVGTVTSVAASGGVTGFAFTGGPITGSGTLTLTVNDAATVRGALGLGTLATQSGTLTDYLLSSTAASTYAAIVHGHAIADVSGLQAALDAKLASATAASTYAAIVHGHAIADVTGLQTALDAKLASATAASTYAAIVHGHAIADVSGLQAALDAKLASSAVSTFGLTLLDDANDSAARSTLGLVIGTHVQAYDADLADLADGTLSGSKVGSGIDAANITTGTLPVARIGTGDIGATQIASTAVTPGSYTKPNLTIDADGRVTSATNSVDNSLQVLGSSLEHEIPVFFDTTGNQLTNSGVTAISGQLSATAITTPGADLNLTQVTGSGLVLQSGTVEQSSFVVLQSPSIGVPWTMVLPPTSGTAGQVMITDGAGVTSWADATGTGTVTSVAASGGTTGFNFSGGTITSSGTFTLAVDNAATIRDNIGLTLGSDVQAYDADLADLADGTLSGSKVGSGIDAANITTGTLPVARIGTGDIGATQIASTAVTPGSYTAADITVDADGRITAASNGSGGSGPDMSVHVTKGGSNQNIVFTADTPVLVTFGTEVADASSRWASNALTVSSGEIWEISGALSFGALNNGQNHRVKLYKDGSLLHTLNDLGLWGASPVSLNFHTFLFEAGSYDIRAELSTSATRDVYGDAAKTYLKARRVK